MRVQRLDKSKVWKNPNPTSSVVDGRTIIYTMTPQVYGRLSRRKGHLNCPVCNGHINIGDRVAKRACRGGVLRHEACARKVNAL